MSTLAPANEPVGSFSKDLSVQPPIRDIGLTAMRSFRYVQDQILREALGAAYRAPRGMQTVETAHRLFDRLTSTKWPKDTVCRFLSGWYSTHGTALFVSGLMIRVHREAQRAGGSAQLLYQAAAEIGEIIPEDTGV